ncbi:MAG TPA: hypothetical protein LFV66_00680 [Rickettsia endosymbiont of Bembidion lapponicum]|nr:hypothetical protein [Rickettsia endosymbiont of Bembidion lapponicum]
MTQDQDNDPKNNESDKLKSLHNKLGSISGFLMTMRSDTIEEQKKISHDLKALMKQINTMQKSIEIYFIVILVLMFFMTQKMLWSGPSKNLSLLTNLF